jgi:hypothetical protein
MMDNAQKVNNFMQDLRDKVYNIIFKDKKDVKTLCLRWSVFISESFECYAMCGM